VLQQKIRNNTI